MAIHLQWFQLLMNEYIHFKFINVPSCILRWTVYRAARCILDILAVNSYHIKATFGIIWLKASMFLQTFLTTTFNVHRGIHLFRQKRIQAVVLIYNAIWFANDDNLGIPTGVSWLTWGWYDHIAKITNRQWGNAPYWYQRKTISWLWNLFLS